MVKRCWGENKMVWTKTLYFCEVCNGNISNYKPEARIKHECECRGRYLAEHTIKRVNEKVLGELK